MLIHPMEGPISAEEQKRRYEKKVADARALYESCDEIKSPYFGGPVKLTSDGFNHLLNKENRQPRNVAERLLKLRLLKKALHTVSVAGTVQEYRVRTEKVGKPAKDGFSKTAQVQYWAFNDIVFGENSMFIISTIVRREANGPHHFWSVMPVGKIEKPKLFVEGIEDR